jgi:predicted metalloprotease with PDZ domain
MNKISPAPGDQAVHYRVELHDLNAHLFKVTMTLAEPAAQQRVSLPVWIPGSYLVREFSKNLQNLQARHSPKAVVPIRQIDKNSWQIDCQPNRPLVITYEIYANDGSVRTAWLDSRRGFFNGTSVFLKADGHEKAAQVLELKNAAIPDWSVATGLTALKVNKQGFGTYQAADYDELVDCPVEMGCFWSGSFKASGVPHRFVVAGALPGFDGTKLLADTQKICEAEIRFWHGSKKPPFQNYLFMLNAVDDGYGGLEHRNSTALICKRQDLPHLALPGESGVFKPSDGYTTLRGLISHEYFHTWNVKRLRPAEFESYRYDQENYTSLLWFFEGFTSYYDDLLLRRAGLLDNAAYLKLLNKTINQVMQTPGRLVQSVAEASFDAWVKYYRQDENTPNATVSYYTKGSLVALCLDLTLRAQAQPEKVANLDVVMRALWLRCQAGVMTEGDLAAVLEQVGQRSYAAELASWVHGKGELPLKALLEQHGVGVSEDPAQWASRLGLRVSENTGLHVKTVLRGGFAEQAGFAPGDEWLAVEPAGAASGDADGWRMSRLDDLPLYAGKAKKVTALVARDKCLLRLQLTMPPAMTTWRLSVRDSEKIALWLAPEA